MSVDDTLSNDGLRGLALGLRGLRADAVSFTSAPVSGLGREGPQSVVYLDADRGRQLWAAVRSRNGGRVPGHPPGRRAGRTPN